MTFPALSAGGKAGWKNDNVRGFLAFFRWLLRPDDAAALETALRLVWQCPQDLIQQAKRACARQNRLDLTALRQALPEGGHAGQWLACAETWLAAAKTENAVEAGRALGHKSMGTCDAMEKLQHTAVFYTQMPALLDALALGQEADICRAAGKAGRQALCG